jgi:hypothetical protein
MASVLPRPRGLRVATFFAAKGGFGLGMAMPPAAPPAQKQFGGYCFRATCHIEDDNDVKGCPIAKIKGYDRSPQIGKDTEDVCRAHARTMAREHGRTYRCNSAEVVMLHHSDMDCSGQFVLVMDGTVRRLV